MINELRWKDLEDGRRDIWWTLFYKIVNHKLNVPSEVIIIQMKGGTRKSQEHKTFMHIGSKIDDYKYYFYPWTIPEGNKLPSTTVNTPRFDTIKDKLKVMTYIRAGMRPRNASVHFLHPCLHIKRILYVTNRFCWLTIQIQIKNN